MLRKIPIKRNHLCVFLLILLPTCTKAFVVPHSTLTSASSLTVNAANDGFGNLDTEWNRLSESLFDNLQASAVPSLTQVWESAVQAGSRGDFTGAITSVGATLATMLSSVGWLPPFLTAVTVLLASLYALSFPAEDYRANAEPYPRGVYDPVAATIYYNQRPLLVLRRFLQIFRLSNSFLFNYLTDKYIWKKEEERRPERAQELLALIQQLGPTAIKVGQALSVRPDLIESEYATALSSLQDAVPPFANDKALELLRQQLGAQRQGQLQFVQKEPVASASIGQVYQGTIATDDGTPKTVAIKVQRPNVLAEIALDLHLVRLLAPWYQKITRTSTDLPGLAQEWGRGFIAELDYRQEAKKTLQFNQEMAKRDMSQVITAPQVLEQYSTERILVTEWVDGVRLDRASDEDVPRLCAVALNAYLIMLLELQSLHCDPHPGNLLRTRDGKLCILDFGMTLDIDPDLQYALLEYVAHLTAEEYDSLPQDLARLGFLKPEKLDFATRSGVLEPLKYFLKQAGQGGGATQVRERIFAEYREKYPGLTDDELRVEMRSEMKSQMQDIVQRESVATGITMEVEDLQKRNRDSFQIPEWFLYTSRAFLTLEGVSLQADENYSLIQSCFPYVAKRLVADSDPRAKKALKELLYGTSNNVNAKRLRDLADGFSSYTTTTKTIQQEQRQQGGGELSEQDRQKKLVETESTITLVKDSADILLNPDDSNLVQSLLVEESALAASASMKDSLREALVENPRRLRESIPLLGSFLVPSIEDQFEPFVRKTEAEQKAQDLAEGLLSTVGRDNGNIERQSQALVDQLRQLEPEQAALVLKELRETLPKYAPLVGTLGNKFASQLLKTANSNMDMALKEVEGSDSPVSAVVRGLNTIAERALEQQQREASSSR